MIDFITLGFAVNFTLFGAAAVAVWLAGSRSACYADGISRVTGLGHRGRPIHSRPEEVGRVLARVGSFSTFGALLGIVVTTLFIAGMAERRDRTILRMGIDSVAVLVVYAGGVAILCTLR